jgi:hypothetical protein
MESKAGNETLKFWAFLTMMLLGVAVAVTLIDLSIKAAILAESNAMKLQMEEWEVRYGQKAAGRDVEGNPSNGRFHGSISSDLLGPDDARLEAGSATADGETSPIPRARNRRKPSAPSGD